MENCIFCNLPSSLLIYEDDHIKVFRDPQPLGEGHLLIAPAQHTSFLWELLHDDFEQFMQQVVTLKQHLSEQGIETTIMNACGAAAGQACEHSHIELVPTGSKRLTKRLTLSKKKVVPSEKLHKAIKKGLAEIFQMRSDEESFSSQAENILNHSFFSEVDKLVEDEEQ